MLHFNVNVSIVEMFLYKCTHAHICIVHCEVCGNLFFLFVTFFCDCTIILILLRYLWFFFRTSCYTIAVVWVCLCVRGICVCFGSTSAGVREKKENVQLNCVKKTKKLIFSAFCCEMNAYTYIYICICAYMYTHIGYMSCIFGQRHLLLLPEMQQRQQQQLRQQQQQHRFGGPTCHTYAVAFVQYTHKYTHLLLLFFSANSFRFSFHYVMVAAAAASRPRRQ